jgi:hypothetical protein
MDKFLDTYDHSKLNQEGINNLQRSIILNEIKLAIKSLPKKKSSKHHGFTAEFCLTIKEELTPILLKLFHEIEREGILSHSCSESRTTLIPKLDKDTT